MQAARSPNRGARLWAIDELRVLRDPIAFQTLLDALHDPAKLVREQAVNSLVCLCQTNPTCRESAAQALWAHLSEATDEMAQTAVREAIQDIEEMT
ncbi:MAG: HEAT repeat domain-containing protein [Ardenticatenales bacterium]|nr:HEAT repeat domain-containing protein [Ardenticatenales bacterium]